jgi:hypothetical protein
VALHSEPLRGIADFSDIQRVSVQVAELSTRARKPSVSSAQRRIYVATTREMFGLCRMFSTYQDLAGHGEPQVVGSLAEACRLLGMNNAEFEPAGW